jgi:hypothetical protein
MIRQPMRATFAWSGGEYGVVWMDYRSNTYVTHFARALPGATYVAGSEIPLRPPNTYSGEPTIVWTGREWALAWSESQGGSQNVSGGRIDAAGAIVPSSIGTLTSAAGRHQWWPTAAWNGCVTAIAYQDGSSGSSGGILLIP